MDEEISIIDAKTRNEKIKNFFIENKKSIIVFLIFIILLIIFFFGYGEYKKIQKKNISDYYNSTVINYSETSKDITTKNLVDIINKKDPTYSTLSLYFIIDNNLITDSKKINDLFDILINQVSLEKEIKNLVIYKKALFNADKIEENELLDILKPLINSKSIWESHALYLLAEYFYSKNQNQKSKEFFNKIILLDNANQEITTEAQKRLNRDLSD